MKPFYVIFLWGSSHRLFSYIGFFFNRVFHYTYIRTKFAIKHLDLLCINILMFSQKYKSKYYVAFDFLCYTNISIIIPLDKIETCFQSYDILLFITSSQKQFIFYTTSRSYYFKVLLYLTKSY